MEQRKDLCSQYERTTNIRLEIYMMHFACQNHASRSIGQYYHSAKVESFALNFSDDDVSRILFITRQSETVHKDNILLSIPVQS